MKINDQNVLVIRVKLVSLIYTPSITQFRRAGLYIVYFQITQDVFDLGRYLILAIN